VEATLAVSSPSPMIMRRKKTSAEGGPGDDTIEGRAGDDFFDGGAGDDVINAGDGADEFFGNEGDDQFNGQGGDDYFNGFDFSGADTFSGGTGNDWPLHAHNDPAPGQRAGVDLLAASPGALKRRSYAPAPDGGPE
jgi:hemolysin type calcium-binding protein